MSTALLDLSRPVLRHGTQCTAASQAGAAKHSNPALMDTDHDHDHDHDHDYGARSVWSMEYGILCSTVTLNREASSKHPLSLPLLYPLSLSISPHRLVFPTPWIASGPPFRTEPATLALDSIATDPPFITATPIISYSRSSVLYRDLNLHDEPFWVTPNFKLCRVLPWPSYFHSSDKRDAHNYFQWWNCSI